MFVECFGVCSHSPHSSESRVISYMCFPCIPRRWVLEHLPEAQGAPNTHFSFEVYRRKTIDLVRVIPIGRSPLSQSMEHWYPYGINEPRHYTDLKTIVKAPRILQEMSLMVLMVAAARPTPVIRLVLWFCHPNDWEIFCGCGVQNHKQKIIHNQGVWHRETPHPYLSLRGLFISFFSFLTSRLYDAVYSHGSILWTNSDFLNLVFLPFVLIFTTSTHRFH